MPAPQRKVLNVARDESLLTSRSAILESAGYEVVPALNILEVERACEEYVTLDLVILGYALPKGEKRRVMMVVRRFCGRIPILELYPHGSTPVDEEADEELSNLDEAEALLAKVDEMLSKKRKRRIAAS